MSLTSAAGLTSLLHEPAPIVREFALKNLNKLVDEFWHEISDSLEIIESFFGNGTFMEKKLAATLASKVYFHLGLLDESLLFALRADEIYNFELRSDYLDTLRNKSIDVYINLRKIKTGHHDPRLEEMVNSLFQKCFNDGCHQQAVGLAIDAERLDVLEFAISKSENVAAMLRYSYDVATNFIQEKALRESVLRVLIEIHKTLDTPIYYDMCRCLSLLNEHDSIADVLRKLMNNGYNAQLMAYQLAFDLYESTSPDFLGKVIKSLLKEEDNEELQVMLQKLISILKGHVTANLESKFLAKSGHADADITKIGTYDMVTRLGVLISNAFMNAGTSNDDYLKNISESFSKASNWCKFSAVSSLGVVYRSLEDTSHFRKIITDIAGDFYISSEYSEGGLLYGLGFQSAKGDAKLIEYLLNRIEKSDNDVIKHGGCLGLGLAALGSKLENVCDKLKHILYQDDAITGEAAAMAIGMVMCASGDLKPIIELVSYARETEHGKIIRGISIGIPLIMVGKCEEADEIIEMLLKEDDLNLRQAGCLTIATAYCGSSNLNFIQKLLYVTANDKSDDVKRSAVIALGFVLFKEPEKCILLADLLIESHNPHVRYGTAISLGISFAGSANEKALELLKVMATSDEVNFAQQGALIATALILMQSEKTDPNDYYRQLYTDIVSNKYKDLIVKFGAILAQGLIDAGGRKMTMSLQNKTGDVKMSAVAGMILFLQHWNWFPLFHCLTLALTPTYLMGINEDLKILNLNFTSKIPLSSSDNLSSQQTEMIINNNKEEEVVLSVKLRKNKLTGRGNDMKITEIDEDKGVAKAIYGDTTKDGDDREKKTNDKHEVLQNPAKVKLHELKFISLLEGSGFKPLKDLKSGGIVVLKSESEKEEK